MRGTFSIQKSTPRDYALIQKNFRCKIKAVVWCLDQLGGGTNHTVFSPGQLKHPQRTVFPYRDSRQDSVTRFLKSSAGSSIREVEIEVSHSTRVKCPKSTID